VRPVNESRSGALRATWKWTPALLLVTALSPLARAAIAQDAPVDTARVVEERPPTQNDQGDADSALASPAPMRARDSVLAGEVHVQAVAPFVDSLCPSHTECLLKEGFGVGGSLERRWSFGGALVFGYDLSFLSGSGVYEVGTLQTLRAGAKYVIPLGTQLTPYIDLEVGALLFGDTFQVATAGGAVQLGAGIEYELSDTLSFVAGLVFRGFTTGSFITGADRVVRGRDPGASLALLIEVGVLFLGDRL